MVVKLRNNQRVALTHRGERLLQAGSAAVAAGHAVIEIDPVIADSKLTQRVALSSEILLIGRAAGVADQNTARLWWPELSPGASAGTLGYRPREARARRALG
jgi:hypothetical protein